jgi:hypothetical protein
MRWKEISAPVGEGTDFHPGIHLFLFEVFFFELINNAQEAGAQAVEAKFELFVGEGVDGGDIHEVIILALKQYKFIVEGRRGVEHFFDGFEAKVEAFGDARFEFEVDVLAHVIF